MHVDMDAFFASVEQRDRPQLRDKPVIVGGSADTRGVVAAASYEARKFGVRSAMSMAQALRLCPQAIRLSPNGEAYRRASNTVMAILRSVTDLVEPVSIDEAYMDVSAQAMEFDHALAIGRRVKEEILRQTQLTASIGIAPNKFLSKIASDYDKPNGFFIIRPHEVSEFLAPLTVRIIPGVGARTQERLQKRNIRTVQHLRNHTPQQLAEIVGNKHGLRLYQLAHGSDSTPVVTHRQRKSVSQERTFPSDLSDRTVMKTYLRELCVDVATILEKKALRGRTVGLKIRYHDFQLATRSVSLGHFTQEAQEIDEVAQLLFDRVEFKGRRVRLLGVRMAGLDNTNQETSHNTSSAVQLTLW